MTPTPPHSHTPTLLPYGRQSISDADIAAVSEVLRSDWLTQGPKVEEFERRFAEKAGARLGVAVNSGTAALHAAMYALGIGPGDEVIVPPMTFTATANCVVFQGGTPVFADIDPRTGLIDPREVEKKITKKTRAIIAVDYSGHPCDYDALSAVARRHGVELVADGCHAPGATYGGKPVGSLARMTAFSFHPVKHIATGEGGMVTTDDAALAARMRTFRTHGITREASQFRGLGGSDESLKPGPWYYEMIELGFNYRISDINCALGLSQLGRLDEFVVRRRAVAAAYEIGLRGLAHLKTPTTAPGCEPSWHLYPVRIDFAAIRKSRAQVMAELKAFGVGTQVHYIPVCLQPFYRERFGYRVGQFPGAEAFYREELSIPMYSSLSDEDVTRVIAALRKVIA